LVDAANSALEAFEEARRLKLTRLQAVDRAKAAKYARQLLAVRIASGTGQAVYSGNHVLGVLALYKGDVATAKKHLMAASKAPVSWWVKQPGPDFSLAERLLEMGEREAVCAFLANVKAAAASVTRARKRDALLERWVKRIQAGQAVDFNE
jgi:hypothetical protein